MVRSGFSTGDILDNRYKIIKVIGDGGFGKVYKVEDTRLGKTCAVKELFTSRIDPKELKYCKEKFEEEAKILSSLNHPNIPTIYDYFTAKNGNPCLVMDYINGKTLFEVLEEAKSHGKKLVRKRL